MFSQAPQKKEAIVSYLRSISVFRRMAMLKSFFIKKIAYHEAILLCYYLATNLLPL